MRRHPGGPESRGQTGLAGLQDNWAWCKRSLGVYSPAWWFGISGRVAGHLGPSTRPAPQPPVRPSDRRAETDLTDRERHASGRGSGASHEIGLNGGFTSLDLLPQTLALQLALKSNSRFRVLILSILMASPGASMAQDFKKHIADCLSSDPSIRATALQSLRMAGEKSIPTLAECSRTGSSDSKTTCISLLADIKGPKAYEALASVAKSDGEWAIRAKAIELMASLRAPTLASDLVNIAKTELTPFGRITAIRHLAYRSRGASFGQLKSLYDSEQSIEVKLEIARELGRYGDKRGRDIALQTLASNQEWRVREAAIRALATTCQAQDIDLVKTIQKDKREFIAVRSTARKSLPEMRFSLTPESSKWDFIVAATSDSEPSVREWAVAELRNTHTDRARKKLDEIASSETHPSSRQAKAELETLKRDFGD